MKDQIDEMREYMGHKSYCDVEAYGGEVFEGMTVHCTCGLNKALADIPDQDPMEKLLEWLHGSRALFEKYEAWRDIRVADATIQDVITYIEQELGYTLPDKEGR